MQNDIKKRKKKAPIICAAVVIAFGNQIITLAKQAHNS